MRIRFPVVVVAFAVVALAIPGCSNKEADKSEKVDPGLGAKTGGIPSSREGQMYLLGEKLAQAAMVNGSASPDLVARTFKAASTISDVTLKQPLDPLPQVTGDRAEDGAAGMSYLLNGQGKVLGAKIATDFGEASVATYELGLKINMLPMLYIDDPKDSMGDTMAEVLGQLATKAKLPDSAVGPMIAKLKARAPNAEVTDLALGLNTSLPIAIAAIYEKEVPKK